MILRRIVVVSREAEVQELAQRIGQQLLIADDIIEALDIAQTANPDLIVFDARFGPDCVSQFLDAAEKNLISVPLVVIGDNHNQTCAPAEFIRAGARDFLPGPDDYPKLEQIANQIKHEHGWGDSETGASHFFAEDFASEVEMVGRSKAARNTLKMIKLIAVSQCNPVLIVGETGTGKELAAKAVHNLRCSGRKFVAVNCAALTANLLESEFFGHVKGSFTGADRKKTGLFELAGDGTIFLDEISEMPMDLQAKLLRVLQEKTFRKVGGTDDIVCSATIIASSNRNLYKEVDANRFRRDLYYRLDVCPINIAPLRSPDRRCDIKLLTEYFLNTSTICPEKKGKIKSLTKLATEALEMHDWPGNIRELRNVIERAILLETTDKVGLSSIVIDSTQCDGSHGSKNRRMREFSLAKAERELITRALQETGWQKTRAADLLGITRSTLYAKVKQYNIEKGIYLAKKSGDQVDSLVTSLPVSL